MEEGKGGVKKTKVAVFTHAFIPILLRKYHLKYRVLTLVWVRKG